MSGARVRPEEWTMNKRDKNGICGLVGDTDIKQRKIH